MSARASLTLAAAHMPLPHPQESSAYDTTLGPIDTSSGDGEDLKLPSHVGWSVWFVRSQMHLACLQRTHQGAGIPSTLELGSQLFSSLAHP